MLLIRVGCLPRGRSSDSGRVARGDQTPESERPTITGRENSDGFILFAGAHRGLYKAREDMGTCTSMKGAN